MVFPSRIARVHTAVGVVGVGGVVPGAELDQVVLEVVGRLHPVHQPLAAVAVVDVSGRGPRLTACRRGRHAIVIIN